MLEVCQIIFSAEGKPPSHGKRSIWQVPLYSQNCFDFTKTEEKKNKNNKIRKNYSRMWITSPHTIHMSILHNYHFVTMGANAFAPQRKFQILLSDSHRNFLLIYLYLFRSALLSLSLSVSLHLQLSLFLPLPPSLFLPLSPRLFLFLPISSCPSLYLYLFPIFYPAPSPMTPSFISTLYFICLYLSHSRLFSLLFFTRVRSFECAH